MDMTQRKMTKIAREVSKFTVRTLRQDGIGPAEFDVIHAIRKNPGITQADVCKITGVDKGSVARQTANLEAKGYLTRKENPTDGRSRRLFATEKAEELKHSKAHIESLFYEWLMEPMSESERKIFSDQLDILYRRCKAESKEGFKQMEKRVRGSKEDEG